MTEGDRKGWLQDHEEIRSPIHENLLGVSSAMHEVNEMVQRVAKSDITVLITGESGTGKDIVAKMLHRLSPRQGKPFVKVNCPAVPESIFESELFGYERGAFTGARTSKPGRFELAHRGTIFLDEIAETPYRIQGKLLQVFDGEPFMRIGGSTPIRTDVRAVAATNMDLDAAVQDRRMREDIYFRLSEVIIHMPPLRDRCEDVGLLAEHFNYNYSERFGKDYRPLARDVIARLEEEPWPGNVRELGARVKKYVATGKLDALFEKQTEPSRPAQEAGRTAAAEPEPAPAEDTPGKAFMPLKEAARQAAEAAERALIEEALRYTLWNRRKAAQLLDISYSSLLRRIDTYGLGKTKPE
ncbi:MAG: sigma-54-dependent Fis family transcriptional regulator [Candidatus Hydrogenedentes bacterium]|nr:sigma-54-dependent Fis family transcriptional regulator [Candidatus Hydrogenedentota bacterium]